MVKHPVEDRMVNTYFYEPPNGDASLLQRFAAQNTEGVGELLAGFFRYFGYEFDYAADAVSIKSDGPVSKLIKAEEDCWPTHTRLSIEDPFESWYDVAHPVKLSRHEWIRKCFARLGRQRCGSNWQQRVRVVNDVRIHPAPHFWLDSFSPRTDHRHFKRP